MLFLFQICVLKDKFTWWSVMHKLQNDTELLILILFRYLTGNLLTGKLPIGMLKASNM